MQCTYYGLLTYPFYLPLATTRTKFALVVKCYCGTAVDSLSDSRIIISNRFFSSYRGVIYIINFFIDIFMFIIRSKLEFKAVIHFKSSNQA